MNNKQVLNNIHHTFTLLLSHLKAHLTESKIKEIDHLPLHGKRELVRDILIFIIHHQKQKKGYEIIDNAIIIKKKQKEKKLAKKIAEKYDYQIPIIKPETIASYLPDILMMAKVDHKLEIPQISPRHVLCTSQLNRYLPIHTIMIKMGHKHDNYLTTMRYLTPNKKQLPFDPSNN